MNKIKERYDATTLNQNYSAMRVLLFKTHRTKDVKIGVYDQWSRWENFREFYEEQKGALALVMLPYADRERGVLRIARMFLLLQALPVFLPKPTRSRSRLDEEDERIQQVQDLMKHVLEENRADVLVGFRQHYPDLLDDMLRNNSPT